MHPALPAGLRLRDKAQERFVDQRRRLHQPIRLPENMTLRNMAKLGIDGRHYTIES